MGFAEVILSCVSIIVFPDFPGSPSSHTMSLFL